MVVVVGLWGSVVLCSVEFVGCCGVMEIGIEISCKIWVRFGLGGGGKLGFGG